MAVATVGGVSFADSKYIAPITPDKMKWNPIDPKNPKGPSIAVLSGDPQKGPVTLELKLTKGPMPVHWHSSEYSALIVDGKTKHWLAGEDAAKAPVNGPGTYWFQPGGSDKTAHGDECITDTCTIYIVLPGKFDMTVVPPPAKK